MPNYAIRGSYLHVSRSRSSRRARARARAKRLYRSTGTPEKRVAKQALRKLKRDIESGACAWPANPTFASAALISRPEANDRKLMGIRAVPIGVRLGTERETRPCQSHA